jgi:hypothetical protein
MWIEITQHDELEGCVLKVERVYGNQVFAGGMWWNEDEIQEVPSPEEMLRRWRESAATRTSTSEVDEATNTAMPDEIYATTFGTWKPEDGKRRQRYIRADLASNR